MDIQNRRGNLREVLLSAIWAEPQGCYAPLTLVQFTFVLFGNLTAKDDGNFVGPADGAIGIREPLVQVIQCGAPVKDEVVAILHLREKEPVLTAASFTFAFFEDQSILEEIKPVVSEAVFETLNESIRRKEELLERLQRGNKLLRELRRLELLEKYGPSAVAGPPGARGRARFRKQREISHSNLVGRAFPRDW